MIFTFTRGFYVLSVFNLFISQTVSIPFITLPKTVCLLSSQGQATTVMKNCEPFELGFPGLAIANKYGRSNRCFYGHS